MAELLVSCVQNRVLDVMDGPPAPGRRLLVRQLIGAADLG